MEIELRGLRSSRLGTALALFGLLEVVDCRIKFKKDESDWYGVIDSKLSLDELVNILSSEATWNDLWIPPQITDYKDYNPRSKVIAMQAHDRAIELNPRFALSVGTDQVLSRQKNDDTDKKKGKPFDYAVEESPFYLWGKNVNMNNENVGIPKFKELASNKENTRKHLTINILNLEDCADLGVFFVHRYFSRAFDNWATKATKPAKGVGVFCLLCLAAYRLFPCFLSDNNSVVTFGWHRNKNGEKFFAYPIISEFVSKYEFVSLTSNVFLGERKFKSNFKLVGVDDVFTSRLMTKDKTTFFTCPKPL